MRILSVVLLISLAILVNGKSFNGNINKNVIYGDIMPSKREKGQLPENARFRSYIDEKWSGPDGTLRWPDNTVPYTFTDKIDKKGRLKIKAALKELQQKSCFKFVEKTDQHDSFVEFDDDGGSCRSFVGRQGGKQTIFLQKWCVNERQTIQHEVFHALGFGHEHQRPDRDNYIKIFYRNMEEGGSDQMIKDADGLIDLSLPYDPYSIMHYYGRVFAKFDRKKWNYMVTMKIKRNGKVVPDNKKLTNLDLKKLRKLGNCPEPSKRRQANKRKRQG